MTRDPIIVILRVTMYPPDIEPGLTVWQGIVLLTRPLGGGHCLAYHQLSLPCLDVHIQNSSQSKTTVAT